MLCASYTIVKLLNKAGKHATIIILQIFRVRKWANSYFKNSLMQLAVRELAELALLTRGLIETSI